MAYQRINYREDFISRENLEKIHEHSLLILEEVGVIFEDERALDALKSRGAKIEGSIAYIPRSLVEESLKLAPSSFTLKNKGRDIQIGGGADPFLLPWGLSVFINDKGDIRKLNNKDMIDFFKLTDSSPVLSGHTNFNLHNRETYTQEQYDFGHLALAYKYANKPCFVTGEYHDINKFYECFDIIRRFNGLDKIQDAQLAMLRMNPLSPLTYDAMGVQFLLAACDMNQPVMMAPCAMPGLTTAPTLVGSIAVCNAEVLAGITLAQVIKPGTPVLYGNTSGSSDLRYVQPASGAPEAALVAVCTTALGHELYNLPVRAGGGMSDAVDTDYQAGSETAYMMMATMAARPDWIFHTVGHMGCYNLVSLEKQVLDEENIVIQNRFQRGINFDDKQFCHDMVKKVGPRGSYLEIHHSKIFRENFVIHKSYNKKDPSKWVSDGSVSVKDAAYDTAIKRISDWTPPVLDKEQLSVLDPYLPEEYKNEI